nr:furin-like protease 1 isoform X3 [Drosophila kikkawai]
MKNDVVRWSRQPTSNSNINISSSSSSSSSSISRSSISKSRSNISSSSSHKHKSRRDKLNARQLGQHAARSCQQRATQQEEEQQTIIECDIGNFNFNCNLFKTSFLTQCKPKLSTRRSSSSSSSTTTTTRHLARTKAALLFILQFSAVVFLCNYNVGFVAGSVASASASAPTPASSAPAPPPPPAPSSLKVDPSGQSPVLPPYVLDYETGGRAKLTPNSGKYGSSGISGGNNQIAGHYTHTWAVHIPNGDNGMADAVAKDHGFVNLGKVSLTTITIYKQSVNQGNLKKRTTIFPIQSSSVCQTSSSQSRV